MANDPAGEMPNEPKLKLRAKSMITLNTGKVIKTGEVFELPEREALNLVGMGDAEQLPQK